MFDAFAAKHLIDFYMAQYEGLNIKVNENIRDGIVEVYIDCKKNYNTAIYKIETNGDGILGKINLAIINFLAIGGYESDTSEI